MKTSLIILFALAISAHGQDLFVRLKEQATGAVFVYSVNSDSVRVTSELRPQGRVLPLIAKYTILNRLLTVRGVALTKADEILFQAAAGGSDFIVLREEFNSTLGPLNLALYLGAHPVQVSKIAIVKISAGRLIIRRNLIQKEGSYHWSAEILK